MLEWFLFLFFAVAAVVGTAVGLVVASGVWWAPVFMLVVPLLLGAGYLIGNRHRLRFWWEYRQMARR